jgi:peptide methionine sulfoxide reductase msrA/msrB
LVALAVCTMADLASADDYSVAEGNKSLLVAVGCFWCGEQAFEQYAPGVIEVVSGYAGGENENPSEYSDIVLS